MRRGGYRGRGQGRGGSRGGHSDGRLRGLFEDRIWKCDCTPRLPAEHFQVRKESPNKGRWFHTCQSKPGCGFFLWDEDAKPRMEAAVLNNSTSEPHPPPHTRLSRGIEDTQASTAPTQGTPPPPYTLLDAPKKRKLPWQEFDEHEEDEEVFPWPLTAEEEQSMSQATDDAEAAAHISPPVTPRKVARLDDVSSPGATRRLPTPGTTPHKADQLQSYTPATPTPLRYGEALLPDTPSSSRQDEDLTASVFDCLKSHNVTRSNEVGTSLRALLDRHHMKDQGVVRGRDVARQTIQKRDATIVHQAQRIAELETELESVKARISYARQTSR